jgi:hypothetical protein
VADPAIVLGPCSLTGLRKHQAHKMHCPKLMNPRPGFDWLRSKKVAQTCACVRYRAGELSAQELEQLMVIVSNPRTFKVGFQTAIPVAAA